MSTSDNSGVDTTGAYRDGLNRWPVFDVEFVLESTDLGDDQCTFYPRNADEEQMLTTWITAAEGDFVTLDDAR
ncbi:hypothetical protein ACFO0N_09560 [Halobium salinum]|uniref:DUF7511 domain-containing protein n=1 Tax=Halobium salinum TaxID=1364940 RepID=A0ABD5PBS6_9EURY|nr:hypothetical protein [Halobium salinum]